MPIPISDGSIKIIWENNPDSPLTSSNLSKTIDYIGSYKDFEDGHHGEGSILLRDPLNPFRLIMKRGTVISIVNEADNPPGSGNYVVPTNEQYRVFDLGLEDVWLTFNDRDDDLTIPAGEWGQNREWFVYICDKDDSTLSKVDPDDYGGGAQILISRNINYPTGQVPGRPSELYNVGDTRKIGGFKTDGTGQIITDSVWDISGKAQVIKAKKYYIIDENNSDPDDPYGRHLFRPLRVTDLDSSFGANNIFHSNVTVEGDFNVRADSVSQDKFKIDHTSNLTTIVGNVQIKTTAGGSDILTLDIINNETTVTGDFGIRRNASQSPYIYTDNTTSTFRVTGTVDADFLVSNNSMQCYTAETSYINITGTSGKKIQLDDGEAMITVHDGFGNFNIKVGVDESENYITAGSGASKITLNNYTIPGSVSISVASEGLAVGAPVTYTQTYLFDNTGLKITGAGYLEYNQSAPTGTTILGYDGYFYATRVYNAVYNDIAEFFVNNSFNKPEYGKIYSLHSNKGVLVTNKKADTKIIGICSNSYAYVMKSEYEKELGVPIALAGTVEVFVDSIIEEGDELTSDDKGFAMKASWFTRIFKRSAIIGKALQNSKDNEKKKILILVK